MCDHGRRHASRSLRPAELEDQALHRDLHREVLLGDQAVFDSTQGVKQRIRGKAILLEQPQASLMVDSLRLFDDLRIVDASCARTPR